MKDSRPNDTHETGGTGDLWRLDYYADTIEAIKGARTPGEAFAAALIARAEACVNTIPVGRNVNDKDSDENSLRYLNSEEGLRCLDVSQRKAVRALNTLKTAFHDKENPAVSALEVFVNKLAEEINRRPGSVLFGYPIQNVDAFADAVKWIYTRGNDTVPGGNPAEAYLQGSPASFLPLARALRSTHESVIPVGAVPSKETNDRLYLAILQLLPDDRSTWSTDKNSLSIDRQVVWGRDS